MAGYDQKSNVVLSESKERVYSLEEGVEEIPLGLYLVKGDMMCVPFLRPTTLFSLAHPSSRAGRQNVHPNQSTHHFAPAPQHPDRRNRRRKRPIHRPLDHPRRPDTPHSLLDLRRTQQEHIDWSGGRCCAVVGRAVPCRVVFVSPLSVLLQVAAFLPPSIWIFGAVLRPRAARLIPELVGNPLPC